MAVERTGSVQIPGEEMKRHDPLPYGLLRRARKRGRGAVAVEFALIAPLLLMLVFGIIDFAYMFNRDTLVNNLTRDAARSASIGESFSSVQSQIVSDLVRVGLCKSVGSGSTAAKCPEGTEIKIGYLNDQTSMQQLDQWDPDVTSQISASCPWMTTSAVYTLPSSTSGDNTIFTTSTMTQAFDTCAVRGTAVSVELTLKHHWLTPIASVCTLFSGSCVGQTILLDKTAVMTRE